ncbi:ATPase [Alphaproteobacteria bacterium]|nr:ATPase [Alphaproteobacteria bacterium]
MKYLERIVEDIFQLKMSASGAVLVRGPKACGKTEMSKQYAKSVLEVDRDPNVEEFMATSPARLLTGDTPRLIDEWQEQPKLWIYIRHEVDDRKKPGQFILTGSSTPNEVAKMHSGAGRFGVIEMRTMTWRELGYSTGVVSLGGLLKGEKIKIVDHETELDDIIARMIRGGWPRLIDMSQKSAAEANRDYIDLIANVDISRVSSVKRDPVKAKNLLKSLARNIATPAEITTIEADVRENEVVDMSRPTIMDYLGALERLMIVEDQPAWNTHIRSSASLRKTPKRHLADVSLAIAVLHADKQKLLDELRYTGFLFESLVIHDLRVYAQANDATVSYYRDSTGLEVDAIVEKANGDWAAFEVKLGPGKIEEATDNLRSLADVVDAEKKGHPKSLNVIVGTGVSYTRADGINVISLASLGY